MNILDKIIKQKRERLNQRKEKLSLEVLKEKITDIEDGRSFKKAISVTDKLCLIAEIKKSSPSKGIIIEEFSPERLALIYEQSCAHAISILTEEDFFQGDIYHIPLVRNEVNLPILRKDFIFDEYQIYESKAFGADALLFIARILDRETLERFVMLSKDLKIDPVVEVHDENDLTNALRCKAEIIGINNRNLEDFKVDLGTTLRLRDKVSPQCVIISESGIHSMDDILLLKRANINAVLIGEAFLKSGDIKAKIKELGF